jgi:hypothetical protein
MGLVQVAKPVEPEQHPPLLQVVRLCGAERRQTKGKEQPHIYL